MKYVSPLLFVLLMNIQSPVEAQIRPINEDESKVPAYTVPSCLTKKDGTSISDKSQWPDQRKYLVELLAENEFGVTPNVEVKLESKVIEEGLTSSGKSLRRQMRITLSRNNETTSWDAILFLPANSKGKVPCFLALNFRGNHAMSDDAKIALPTTWVPKDETTDGNKATEKGRNQASHRWPIDEITERGYGLASIYYGDIGPDQADIFESGVMRLFPEYRSDKAHPDRWGAIAVWAWGLSRLADVVASQTEIDPNGLMVVGHSRLGKTALWAGVTDERFKIVYSNNSGCGGAALSKRVFGESVARINTSFPHWFCKNFHKYNDKEEELPVEQNMLIAAVAPRPVYIASASEDLWADPKGEYLGGWYANPAYELLGLKGLPSETMPSVDQAVGSSIGFHLRPGKHDLLSYDWKRFMDFADQHKIREGKR